MKFAKRMFNLKKEIYKRELQKFNQDQWGEPIDVMFLIYSNYSDNLIAKDKKEIVFVNSDYELEWLTNYELSKKSLDLINELQVMKSLPYKYLPSKHRLSFLKIIGQGIVAAFTENEDDVKNCLAQACSFHKALSFACYKKTRFEISTTILAILFVCINIVNGFFFPNAIAPVVQSVILWSVVGSYLSICYKTAKDNEYLSIDKHYILWDIIVRFVVGIIFGAIVYYVAIIKLFGINSQTIEEFSMLALIAGFSEKFIPGILDRYENKFCKEK